VRESRAAPTVMRLNACGLMRGAESQGVVLAWILDFKACCCDEAEAYQKREYAKAVRYPQRMKPTWSIFGAC
jgi:hypothetical protein